MNIKLLFLIPALILSACSIPKATNVLFQPVQTIPANSSIVYFYRPEAYFNSAGWVELFIDEEMKFALVNNSYGYVVLNEGDYDIKLEGSMWGTNWWPGPATAKLSVASGREIYVRILPLEPGTTIEMGAFEPILSFGARTFGHFSKAHTDIRVMEKNLALKEIRPTTLIEQ